MAQRWGIAIEDLRKLIQDDAVVLDYALSLAELWRPIPQGQAALPVGLGGPVPVPQAALPDKSEVTVQIPQMHTTTFEGAAAVPAGHTLLLATRAEYIEQGEPHMALLLITPTVTRLDDAEPPGR